MDAIAAVVAGAGLIVATTVAGVTYWDAARVGVSRPRLWAAATGGTIALGAGLHLFATVPATGVILTANTGPVLYTFEREVATEDEAATRSGALPGGTDADECRHEE